MPDKKISILYADSDTGSCGTFKAEFQHRYEIFTASSVRESLDVLDMEDIHVVIADQKMAVRKGSGLLEIITKKHPELISILLTASTDIGNLVDAVNRLGIYRYLHKPWKTEALQEAIESCNRSYCINKERKALLARLMQTNKQMEFMLREKLIS